MWGIVLIGLGIFAGIALANLILMFTFGNMRW